MIKPISIIFFLCFTTPALGKIYQWTDNQGKTHFSDNPPAQVMSQLERAAPSTSDHANREAFNQLTLDCELAVEQGKQGLAQLLATAQTNYINGVLVKQDYLSHKKAISQLKQTISVEHCQQATAQQHDFYLCLSKSNHDLKTCHNKYQGYGLVL